MALAQHGSHTVETAAMNATGMCARGAGSAKEARLVEPAVMKLYSVITPEPCSEYQKRWRCLATMSFTPTKTLLTLSGLGYELE